MSLLYTGTNPWNTSPAEAVALQKNLRDQVKITHFNRPLKYIAGCDVSLNRFAPEMFAGIIVLSYPDLVPVDYAVFQGRTTFPYIPGLLSFRELPALLECWEILKKKHEEKGAPLPDIIMVDGQGIAHPRRLGIAAHLGIMIDMPTIGCAKSQLYGSFSEPAIEPGSMSVITDRYNPGEIIGTALRSKYNTDPLIVSPGHLISVDEAAKITLSTVRKYRLPEPTRLAHDLVNRFRMGEISAE